MMSNRRFSHGECLQHFLTGEWGLVVNSSSAKRGVVASGHRETSAAGARVLEEGGNAFDAVLAAMCAATVAEPMLVSLGGGGFLLAQPGEGEARVYDFFCQTPQSSRPAESIDFYPFIANFGTARQEFHMGMGSMAVPGVVAGLFSAHADLGKLPLVEVVRPAMELAQQGVTVTDFQAEVIQVLQSIYQASDEARWLYTAPGDSGELLKSGDLQRFPRMAETYQQLAEEGPACFYQGALAERLVSDCAARGGLITHADLQAYRVEKREPITFKFHDARIAINSPPSLGGGLVAFALSLLNASSTGPGEAEWGSEDHLAGLVRAMRSASRIRSEYRLDEGFTAEHLGSFLAPEVVKQWCETPTSQLFSRGTTHISVADAEGNLASLTASNGEGCGYVLPGTDIMMNNMLGEEDLNPLGFHRWKPGTRLASMMSPAVARLSDGTCVALGSGGSNRIRSAVSQVLVNLVDYDMSLADAIQAPRLHLEKGKLSMEGGFPEGAGRALEAVVETLERWEGKNLFFGGVHAVSYSPQSGLGGFADPRRSGHVAFANLPLHEA